MKTTIPLERTIGACSPTKPEWLRLPDAIRVSGIGRSTLYDLISTGAIKSVCLRKRGCQRGIRLINAESLQNYIESFSKGDISEYEETQRTI
jgi:hypothetical protein